MENIDLVLSGSGVRFGCHYGAILALKKKKYNITRIAGTSGGAIIAAAYASHYPFENIWHIIKHMDISDLMCDGKVMSWLRLIKYGGLYKGDRFEKFIDKNITHGTKLNDAPGLFIVATDLTNRKPLVLSYKNGFGDMKISRAVRMSMSAPIYWEPKTCNVKGEICTVVDGGISANYYIDLFDDNSRPTIGISLYKEKKKSKINIINYFRNIIDTVMTANENEHIEDAYWSKTIKVGTGDISPFDLDITPEQIEWTIKRGYQETLDAIDNKIKKGENDG